MIVVMITALRLKFGAVPGATPLEIDTTPLTLFIGPNNSGKSRVLYEIHKAIYDGYQFHDQLILDSLEFSAVDEPGSESIIGSILLPALPSDVKQEGIVYVGSASTGRSGTRLADLKMFLAESERHKSQFCSYILKHLMIKLDGTSRLNLTAMVNAGDLLQAPQNCLQSLYQDDSKRAHLREVIHTALGVHFVIDPTNLGKLRVRFSSVAPSSEEVERGVDARAVEFHRAARLIDEASDGVKAFTGIMMQVMAGNPQVVFIDEPEAFLHPALTSRLGLEVAKSMAGGEKRLFSATHSPNFLMGCIQSGVPLSLVRLTYSGGVPTARTMKRSEVSELMRNPLLRSTGALNGLFYEYVVVTESEADRAFYQEINHRLLECNDDRGIPNCLFLNAQNKQTVRIIVEPLRRMGIPTAGVVDVDVFKEGGKVWTDFLKAAGIPDITSKTLQTHRSAILEAMKQTEKDMKKDGGIAILEQGDRESANSMLELLGGYGIFVVPGGELESWLTNLSVPKHGPQWLIKMFEVLGSDPRSAGYISPAQGDVWDFLGSIKSWLCDPLRKGIPAG